MLLKDRALTATVVLALALGIGANTALFTIMRSVLLRPLPYPQPHELMRVWSSDSRQPETRFKVSYPDFVDLQSRNRSFDSLGAFVAHTFIINNNRGEMAHVEGALVTSDIFPMLGARAALGRIFSRHDDEAGNRSAIISDQLWEERFGRAANVTDASLMVEGEKYTVIGVMPRGFRFPMQNHAVQVWITFGRYHEPLPDERDGYAARRDARYLHLLGRLKPDRTRAEAQFDLNTITAGLSRIYPETSASFGACVVTPWLTDLTSKVRPSLLLLSAAAACLLAVACANIANLLLARGGTRRKEIAIRAALGAARLRIARQLLTESLLLALVGGAAGLLLALLGTRLMVALLPPDFPRAGEITPDGGVLAFAALVTVVTTGIFGFVPAWRSSRSDPAAVLNGGSASADRAHGCARLRNGLVVAEIVLSLVLLACACCLIENVWRLQTAPLGFDPQNVLTATVMPTKEGEASAELLKRVRQLPGVASASAVSRLPAIGPEPLVDLQVAGHNLPKRNWPRARLRIIFPEYFRTMGIAIEQGRDFDERDGRNTVPLTMINESLARKMFPNESALGRHLVLTLGANGDGLEREIVGIVGDMKSDRFSTEEPLDVYLPYPRVASLGYSLLIRSEDEKTAATLLPKARRIAKELNKNVAFYEPGTLEEYVDGVLAQPRLNSAVLAAFALIGMVLTAIGVYGVVAFSVAQRRHEIGIRLALGAEKSAILQLVFGESARIILIAVAAGTLCSLLTLSQLSLFLHHSLGHNFSITMSVALVVSSVALVACWLPAHRAAREDPLHAIGLR